jgi:hypothetical protein
LRKRENTGSIRENTSNVGKFMRRCFTWCSFSKP